MTWLSDTTQLVAPNWLSSDYRGHGIRGADVPSAGTDGGSPVLDDLLFPADSDTELRWNITTLPIDGTLQVFEDLTYIYTPPGGATNIARFFDYSLLAFSTPQYTDREIIVLGIGDYTQVSRDQGLSYSVLAAAQRDQLLAYTVSSAVQTDRSLAWQVLSAGQVLSDQPMSWLVRSAVQADAPLAYVVRSTTQADRSLAWQVLSAGQVLSDQPMSWLVRSAAIADRDLAWAVGAVTSVINDAMLAWTTRASVERDRTLSWVVTTTDVPVRVTLSVRFTQIPTFITRVAR
jgi:hypothetical protein